MKPHMPLLVAVLVAPPVAFATHSLAAVDAAEGKTGSEADSSSTASTAGDEELAARLAALEERLELVQREAHARMQSGQREAVDAIESAVAAALEERGIRLDLEAVEASRKARAEGLADLIAGIDAALEAGDDLALGKAFSRLAENGQIDYVLAEIQKRSDADPTDIDAAVDLAEAAIAAMDTVPYGPRSAGLGALADTAFERALAVDPDRDDIRFDRAVLLARSPTFLGNRPEAIQELEVLVQRGERGGSARAESYRLLGTLLLEQGARDRALDAWERGAGAFPDNATLRSLLELHGRD